MQYKYVKAEDTREEMRLPWWLRVLFVAAFFGCIWLLTGCNESKQLIRKDKRTDKKLDKQYRKNADGVTAWMYRRYPPRTVTETKTQLVEGAPTQQKTDTVRQVDTVGQYIYDSTTINTYYLRVDTAKMVITITTTNPLAERMLQQMKERMAVVNADNERLGDMNWKLTCILGTIIIIAIFWIGIKIYKFCTGGAVTGLARRIVNR